MLYNNSFCYLNYKISTLCKTSINVVKYYKNYRILNAKLINLINIYLYLSHQLSVKINPFKLFYYYNVSMKKTEINYYFYIIILFMFTNTKDI